MNDKPSVAVYKAIGIACGFVVSGTKKLVQQAYTQINLLIVSYALKTFWGEGEFAGHYLQSKQTGRPHMVKSDIQPLVLPVFVFPKSLS
ncbi:hypothetical protein [Vibrio sp. Isolate30]|uniref:hypothetical protein n=1 Tax=Vibrio sp. Isolate30 TaxID=2908536 RepID=UPI001EFE6F60|nr:hypothetical protein [Vibrio sp. Isolate30]MCG9632883.1 hypothetical protein [Vibrio sp. Isolate30]